MEAPMEPRKKPRRRVRGLPRRLRDLFWEYDFHALTWKTDRDLIIGRVLAAGDWPSVRWLRRHLGDAALKSWLVERRGSVLDARRLRFWELVLGLPRREVDRWLRTEARRVWDERVRG